VCSLFILSLLPLLVGGCASVHTVVRREAADGRVRAGVPITWFSPSVSKDRAMLARWGDAVGPPVLVARPPANPVVAHTLTVVSWNIANGGGDIVEFAHTLPQGAPLVMLLQEAYRGGPEVPARLAPDASFAGRLGGATADDSSHEIESIAAALNLSVYYVPSMRNGGASSDEDRGNAILSNLPLSDLVAVELPFERQRRVAIAATVEGLRADGSRWRLRVASAHLDNMRAVKYGLLGGEYGRTRQARALRDVLAGDDPTVLGADFNTWFGFSEKSYIETALAFPETRVTDGRPTFRGLLRLDHLFFRLGPHWRAAFRRADDRFGSDHYPLIGTLQLN
jgi:endonuclease/exonuclease/phosphatase family metal-dependent hydrolase